MILGRVQLFRWNRQVIKCLKKSQIHDLLQEKNMDKHCVYLYSQLILGHKKGNPYPVKSSKSSCNLRKFSICAELRSFDIFINDAVIHDEFWLFSSRMEIQSDLFNFWLYFHIKIEYISISFSSSWNQGRKIRTSHQYDFLAHSLFDWIFAICARVSFLILMIPFVTIPTIISYPIIHH